MVKLQPQPRSIASILCRGFGQWAVTILGKAVSAMCHLDKSRFCSAWMTANLLLLLSCCPREWFQDPSLSSVSVYKQVIIGYLAGLSPLGSIMPHNHDNHRLSSGQGGFFPEWNGGRDFLHKLLTSFFRYVHIWSKAVCSCTSPKHSTVDKHPT